MQAATHEQPMGENLAEVSGRGQMAARGQAQERAPWVWLSGLTLLAAVLRIIRLDQQLWYDEMTTLVQSVRQPFATILTTYTSKNQQLLYSLLGRISVLTFGDHIWSLRLPAVLFGVACVPMLFICGRKMASQREALFASALLAVSYHHVWFSQNARGYTGLVFWTLLATWLFLRGTEEGRPALWAGYGLAVAFGMYTHLTMGIVVAAQAMIYLWLVARETRRTGKLPVRRALIAAGGFVLAGIVTLALYAPILPQLLKRTVGTGGPAMRTEWNSPLWMLLETANGLGAGTFAGLAALAGAALLLLTGLWSYGRKKPLAAALILLPGALTAVAIVAVGQNLWPRFFFFLIGFAFLLLVRGACVCGDFAAWFFGRDEATGHRFGTALLVLLLAASLFPLRAAYLYPKQDFLGAMRYVDEHRQPGEPVIVTGLAIFPYRSYYGRAWPAAETAAELEAARVPGKAAWLVYWSPVYVESRQPEVWKEIHNQFSVVRQFRGTLGDGMIYVCRAEARPGSPKQGAE